LKSAVHQRAEEPGGIVVVVMRQAPATAKWVTTLAISGAFVAAAKVVTYPGVDGTNGGGHSESQSPSGLQPGDILEKGKWEKLDNPWAETAAYLADWMYTPVVERAVSFQNDLNEDIRVIIEEWPDSILVKDGHTRTVQLTAALENKTVRVRVYNQRGYRGLASPFRRIDCGDDTDCQISMWSRFWKRGKELPGGYTDRVADDANGNVAWQGTEMLRMRPLGWWDQAVGFAQGIFSGRKNGDEKKKDENSISFFHVLILCGFAFFLLPFA